MREPIYIPDQAALDAAPAGVPLVAGNGTFVKRVTRLFEAVVPAAPRFEAMPSVKPGPGISLPGWLLRSVMSLFREVHRDLGCECVVVLRVTEDGDWSYVVPRQVVTPASASYDLSLPSILVMNGVWSRRSTAIGGMPEGSMVAGSVHSHASMPAFHSPTDKGDEINLDGIHATIGSFGDESPSYSKQIVVDGMRVDAPSREELEILKTPSLSVGLPWKEIVTVSKKLVGQLRKNARKRKSIMPVYDLTPEKAGELMRLAGELQKEAPPLDSPIWGKGEGGRPCISEKDRQHEGADLQHWGQGKGVVLYPSYVSCGLTPDAMISWGGEFFASGGNHNPLEDAGVYIDAIKIILEKIRKG
jgi:hypothetical protein